MLSIRTGSDHGPSGVAAVEIQFSFGTLPLDEFVITNPFSQTAFRGERARLERRSVGEELSGTCFLRTLVGSLISGTIRGANRGDAYTLTARQF